VARERGLQAEILASLAAVVLTASLALGALVLKGHQAEVERLRKLAARGLLEAAESPLEPAVGDPAGLVWWSVTPEGAVRPRGEHDETLDAASLALAAESRRTGRALLRSGRPWEAVRFAAPVAAEVRVARLAPLVSGGWVLAVGLADVLVFTAFGASLLRGRLVVPLQSLERAARCLAGGDLGARANVGGPREVQQLARAFNQMSEALETRTGALEKAVHELRRSNADLRDARAGLDRAERLAAVGRLAAGVAHEVGNPMGAVLAFVELARRDPGLGEEGRALLGRALGEGERVRHILRQLLDFSRPPRAERGPVDLVQVAEATAGLVRAQRRYAAIQIEVAAEGTPPPALADRNQVAQILLNLLLNAADAMADTAAPRVRVVVQATVRNSRAGEPREAGLARSVFDAVECVVADNGPGIAAEHRERIFDPFFTTKPPGQGTGLGLANALRLAEELGGALELEPSAEGAVFALRLPIASEPASAGGARSEPQASGGGPPQASAGGARSEPQASGGAG
jgi:signal transduction histidine kinase